MELIKRLQGFWVPKYYDYWDDTRKIEDDYLQGDYGTSPPTFCFDKEHEKWRLDFISGDDATDIARKISYFFDSKEELIAFMEKDYSSYEGGPW